MAAKRLELTGKVFQRLTVIEFSCMGKWGKSLWLCKCECGKEKTVCSRELVLGKTRSCGCLRSEISSERFKKNKTHGQSSNGRTPGTAEYRCWRAMKTRCENPNIRGSKNYLGRGIRVCEKWVDSFENFFLDMGKKPTDKHSIDRINNDGDYEPGNCKWSTKIEQANNKRGSKPKPLVNQ